MVQFSNSEILYMYKSKKTQGYGNQNGTFISNVPKNANTARTQ